MRKVVFSTTVFLYCGDEFLLLHRIGDVSVDKNRLNGIGGKLEKGENFLDSAIRETKEETGYIVSPAHVSFCGIANLHGGYKEDWTMCFFNIRVKTKIIPHGVNIKEGKLLWIHKDKVLNAGFEVVDDLHYLWKYIISNRQFFADFSLNKEEKIIEKSIAIQKCVK